MILGVGTDIVQVDRFKSWQNYSKKQFLQIFSENELNDCAGGKELNLECLASRFAAKESFFKALSASLVKLNLTENEFSFMFACQNVEMIKPVWGVPQLKIDWKVFEQKVGNQLPNLQVDLSISHEKSFAISFVVISKIS